MIKISKRDKEQAYYGSPKNRKIVDVVGYFDDIKDAQNIFKNLTRSRCPYPNGCVILDTRGYLKKAEDYFAEFPEKVEYIK